MAKAGSLPCSTFDLEPSKTVSRQDQAAAGAILNALSVDVEDYFQVSLFESAVDRQQWDSMEPRVESNTDRLLAIFADSGVAATFFLLGWVAERYPDLVRRIHQQGHELAVHGYDHRRITTQTPIEFRQDVRMSKQIIEDVAGERVIGYRAPSYSVVEETTWALKILSEEGFEYDSSIFPIHHDLYGIPDSPRYPWIIRQGDGGSKLPLWEFPISTVRVMGTNFPFVGGGYLRQFPMFFIRWGMRRVNHGEQQPVMIYIHPWEIDPDQPRQDVKTLTRVRHYRNLSKAEARLRHLFRDFRFDTIRTVLDL